jgi:hypothetical protein
MELLAWMRQHTGMQPKRITPAPASTSADATPSASPDAPADDLGARRVSNADLVARAEKAFPDWRVKRPALRTIQARLKVGQVSAQKVSGTLRPWRVRHEYRGSNTCSTSVGVLW